MEYGTITRAVHVDASPEVVFEVVSRPEHMREWWPDDAHFETLPGAVGELVWRNAETNEVKRVEFEIVDVDAPRRFSFRWCFAGDDRASAALLVTFDLVPDGTGTQVVLTETGFREMGWEVAVLEATYRDHDTAWARFVEQLAAYAGRVAARS